jgi:hypothetical protein
MKRTINFSLCAFVAFNQTTTQQDSPDTAVFNLIRQAELISSQIPQIADYLTDVPGSRLTNSSGYRTAAKMYILSSVWLMIRFLSASNVNCIIDSVGFPQIVVFDFGYGGYLLTFILQFIIAHPPDLVLQRQ